MRNMVGSGTCNYCIQYINYVDPFVDQSYHSLCNRIIIMYTPNAELYRLYFGLFFATPNA